MKKNLRFSSFLKRFTLSITIISTVIVAGFLLLSEYIQYNHQKNEFRNNYIEQQKEYIKYVALNERDYIQKQKIRLEEQVYDEIKQLVEQAEKLALNLYDKYDGIKSEKEKKDIISDALASFKGLQEYSYVFVTTTTGIGVSYPDNPQFEGLNLNELTDIEGNSVVKEELDLLKTKNEGFITYKSGKSNGISQKQKIAFVKKLAIFDWYISSYEYLENHYEEYKKEIAFRVSNVRFVNGGYVFLNEFDGTPIALNGEVYEGDFNFFDGTDSAKLTVFEKELVAANSNPDGDFFYYKWNKIDDTVLVDKCSFAVGFFEWEWVLGAGFYLDEADIQIKESFRNYRKDFIYDVISILIILLIIIGFEIVLINQFNEKYLSDVNIFFKFFKRAADSNIKLNPDQFNFDEFRNASVLANEMISSKDKMFSDLLIQQQKATESDRLKSAFLANMSHEIRTPMNAIIGFSELLSFDNFTESEHMDHVEIIQSNGEKLLTLINDIIDLSKIEANQLNIVQKEIDLSKFIHSAFDKNKSVLLKIVNKHIEFNLANNLPSGMIIKSDPVRLNQIIDNLLSNAFKFTDKGKVELNVVLNKHEWVLSVMDTGIGIEENNLDVIFDHFHQIEDSMNRQYGGTGLGLAITKRLVELLKGKIEVESKIGEGTTFRISFSIQVSQAL